MPKRGQVTDIKGHTYGKLTVIRFSHTTKAGGAFWVCKCSCTNVELARPRKGADLQRGRTLSCGCLRYDTSYKKRTSEESVINSKFGAYKRGAKERGHIFTIPFPLFKQLILKKCIFCGRLKVNQAKTSTGFFGYNGIDRWNNDLGYVPGNCITACGPCNLAKGRLSAREFLRLVRLIFNNLFLVS